MLADKYQGREEGCVLFFPKHFKTSVAISSEKGIACPLFLQEGRDPSAKHIHFLECFSLRPAFPGERSQEANSAVGNDFSKKAQPSRRKRQY